MYKYYTNMLLFYISIILIGCSTVVERKIGINENKYIDNAQIELMSPGRIKLEIFPTKKDFECIYPSELKFLIAKREEQLEQYNKKLNRSHRNLYKRRIKELRRELKATTFPKITILNQEKTKFTGHYSCSQDKKSVYVHFNETFIPAIYKVKVEEAGEIGDNAFGNILFMPEDKNQFAGPQGALGGATKLNDGLNEGKMLPAQAISRHWWKLEVEENKLASMYFFYNKVKDTLKARLYDYNTPTPVFLQNVNYKETIKELEKGSYLLEVMAPDYGYDQDYAINVSYFTKQKVEDKVITGYDLTVLDQYNVDRNTVAIIFESREYTKIKEGDELLIYNKLEKSREFFDKCKVQFFDNAQGECHVYQRIPEHINVNLRSN